MEQKEIKRAYYAMLVSNGEAPARDCWSFGKTESDAIDGVISALAEAEGLNSAELLEKIGEPFPNPSGNDGRYYFSDYGDTYIYVRDIEDAIQEAIDEFGGSGDIQEKVWEAVSFPGAMFSALVQFCPWNDSIEVLSLQQGNRLRPSEIGIILYEEPGLQSITDVVSDYSYLFSDEEWKKICDEDGKWDGDWEAFLDSDENTGNDLDDRCSEIHDYYFSTESQFSDSVREAIAACIREQEKA